MERVWIEIERDTSAAHEEINTKRAALASAMLRRLGCEGKHDPYWYHPDKRRYCVTIDAAGSFQEMSDNGHWYNLEYFGRTEA